MSITIRRSAVVVLLVFAVACDSGPTSPSGLSQPTAIPSSQTPPAASTLPPLSGPSRTFIFAGEVLYRVNDYTRHSRFVLYDNGAFVLRFPSVGEGGYRGEYKDTDGDVMFDWEGSSTAGPWAATGTLKGDSLIVRYNTVMQFTDFEDAVYVLMP